MAKTPSGILGPISGKVGAVVGASWKGINYIREYVIPANPNTAAQQTERTKFADLILIAKTLLGSILQVYWDPFLRHTSGWAHFVGINRILYTNSGDYDKIHIAEGILESATLTGATYIASSCAILWDTTALGNGSPTDPMIFYVYDSEHKKGWVSDVTTRTDGADGITVGVGRDITKLKCYLFAVDSKTAPTMISFSDFMQPT